MINLKNGYGIVSDGKSYVDLDLKQVKQAIDDLKREIKAYE